MQPHLCGACCDPLGGRYVHIMVDLGPAHWLQGGHFLSKNQHLSHSNCMQYVEGVSGE